MLLIKLKKNEWLFKEGDEGNSFFLVQSGSVKIHVKGKVKRILGKGKSCPRFPGAPVRQPNAEQIVMMTGP